MSKEAMKQALEALERMKGYGNVFLHHRHTQNPYEQVCEAITALREALAEQPAQQEPEYAWPTVADYERDVGFQANEAFRIAWNMARTTNRMLGHTSSQPAQRTWVDLTDEQIDDIYQGAGKNDLKRAREVIAAFKERNT